MSEKASVGSANRSTGGSRGGRSEVDEGEPQPPSVARSPNLRPDLRLNTPQADEGPEQPGGGVAVLPQPRATETRKSMSQAIASQRRAMASSTPPTVRAAAGPSSSDSVVGWDEEGPIRNTNRATSAPAARYVPNSPPRGASHREVQPPAVSPQESPTQSGTRRSEAPLSSLSTGRPAPSSIDNGAAAGAATGVAVAAGASRDTNGSSPLPETEKGQPTGSCSKNKLIIVGVLAVVVIVVVVVVVMVVVVGGDSPAPAPSVSSDGNAPSPTPGTSGGEDKPTLTLATIVERGSLKCGIGMQQGFGSANNGEYEGFDADLCRAVAAGIFGPAATVEYVVVEAESRFQSLQDGEVDLLAAGTSYTMDRDVYHEDTGVGFTFSTPYYYAGLGFAGLPPFAGCADSLNATAACAGMKVCVRDGTTHVDRVLELLPFAAMILSPNSDAYYATFGDGLCNVLAGEPADIAEAVVRSSGYVGEYTIGTNVYSKEPLALVTRDGDAEFSDFVNWIVQALIAAEEQGITQVTADSFTESTLFGEEYQGMFIDAVGAVGNYAELYNRSLEPIIPRAAANTLNQGDTGLVYAFPFGSTTINGPGPLSGGTLETIVSRGHLRCGITRRAVFASFDNVDQEWRGLDVDFCKAVSAAIFNGVTNTIVYQVLPATERFKTLQEGGVDLLARITTVTMERDVYEPNAEAGFSFSQPNFYDGLSFGGIPPYGQCADNLDVISAGCEDLLICVNDGTTFRERLKQLFPERFIVPQQTGELAIQGLANGNCNAIAGGVQDVSPSSVAEVGEYTGEYENGVNRFSKDPLALVTRQDDPQWTSFVYWIVSATFYAEEEGITQATASRMPIVNLFGPLYSRMLRDAIEAVGPYSAIYERNAEDQIPRGGLNLLNVNPLGPQHYPLPGL